MASRFYLPSTGTTPAVTPTASSSWTVTTGAVYLPTSTTSSNSALAAGTARVSAVSGAYRNVLDRVYVSDPLAAQTIAAGTFSAVIKAVESTSTANGWWQVIIRVVSGDGATERGVVYAGSTAAVTPVTTAGAENQEYATTAATRIKNAIATTAVTAQAGDLLLIELGTRYNASATNSTYTLTYGDPSATADYALTAALTTNLVPWVELSQTLTFGAVPAAGTLTEVTQRGRNDDGTQVTATWKAAAGAGWSQPADALFRVRHLIKSAGGAVNQPDWQLFFSYNGGAWTPVTGSSTPVRSMASNFLTEGQTTTQQLGSGSFVAGSISEVDGYYAGANLATDQETEIEGSYVILSTATSVGDTVKIRAHKGDWSAFPAYTTSPAITVAAPLEVPPGTPGLTFTETFESFPLTAWPAGSTQGQWLVKWDGGGQIIPVDTTTGRVLQLESSTNPIADQWGDTASALVVSTGRNDGDVALRGRMRTLAQLRNEASPPGSRGTPNAWEAAWLGWNHSTINGNLERYYYVLLKTIGFELGKVDQTTTLTGGQRFLFTDSTPIDITQWHDVQVQQTGANIKVWVDGVLRCDFTDGPGSGGTPAWGTAGETVMTAGAVALYQEDSRVQFDDIQLGVSSQSLTGTASDVAAASDAVAVAVTRAAADTAGGVDSVSSLAPPAVPTGITVTPTATTAAISWSAVPGADTYDVVVTEVALGSLVASGSDSAGAVDAASAVQSQAVTVADTAGGVDVGTPVVAAAQAAADAADVVDSANAQLTATQTPADVAAGLDAASAVQGLARPVTDVAAGTDATSAVQSQAQTYADIAAGSDAVSVAQGAARTLTDAADAVDAVSTTSAAFVTVTDSAAVVDATSAARSTTTADVAAAGDAVTVIQATQVTVTDTAGAVDAVSVNASGVLSATAADTAGAVDAVSVTASSTRTVTDTASAVDAVAAIFVVQASPADVAAGTDIAAAVQAVTRAPADAAAGVDAATWTAAGSATPTDAAAAVDVATATQAATRTAADTAGGTDAVTANLTQLAQVIAADTAGVTDAAAAALARTASQADTAGAVDAATYTMVRVVFVADTADALDATVPQRTSTRVVADTVAATDAAQVVLANAGLMHVDWRLRYGTVSGGLAGSSVGGRLRAGSVTGVLEDG